MHAGAAAALVVYTSVVVLTCVEVHASPVVYIGVVVHAGNMTYTGIAVCTDVVAHTAAVAASLVAYTGVVVYANMAVHTFLHQLDSQVSIAVLTKHRSESIQLNRVARKVAALDLAAGCKPVLGFCRSGDNSADAPSRKRPRHA